MADRTKLDFTPGPKYDVNIDHAPDKMIGQALFDGKAAWGGAAKQMAGDHGRDNTGMTPGDSMDYEDNHNASYLDPSDGK